MATGDDGLTPAQRESLRMLGATPPQQASGLSPAQMESRRMLGDPTFDGLVDDAPSSSGALPTEPLDITQLGDAQHRLRTEMHRTQMRQPVPERLAPDVVERQLEDRLGVPLVPDVLPVTQAFRQAMKPRVLGVNRQPEEVGVPPSLFRQPGRGFAEAAGLIDPELPVSEQEKQVERMREEQGRFERLIAQPVALGQNIVPVETKEASLLRVFGSLLAAPLQEMIVGSALSRSIEDLMGVPKIRQLLGGDVPEFPLLGEATLRARKGEQLTYEQQHEVARAGRWLADKLGDEMPTVAQALEQGSQRLAEVITRPILSPEERGLRRRSLSGGAISDYMVRVFERVERGEGVFDDATRLATKMGLDPNAPSIVPRALHAIGSPLGVLGLGLDKAMKTLDDDPEKQRLMEAVLEGPNAFNALRMLGFGAEFLPWEGGITRPIAALNRGVKFAAQQSKLLPKSMQKMTVADVVTGMRGAHVDQAHHVGDHLGEKLDAGLPIIEDLPENIRGHAQVLAASRGLDLHKLEAEHLAQANPTPPLSSPPTTPPPPPPAPGSPPAAPAPPTPAPAASPAAAPASPPPPSTPTPAPTRATPQASPAPARAVEEAATPPPPSVTEEPARAAEVRVDNETQPGAEPPTTATVEEVPGGQPLAGPPPEAPTPTPDVDTALDPKRVFIGGLKGEWKDLTGKEFDSRLRKLLPEDLQPQQSPGSTFSKKGRGFAFATFESTEARDRAVEFLGQHFETARPAPRKGGAAKVAKPLDTGVRAKAKERLAPLEEAAENINPTVRIAEEAPDSGFVAQGTKRGDIEKDGLTAWDMTEYRVYRPDAPRSGTKDKRYNTLREATLGYELAKKKGRAELYGINNNKTYNLEGVKLTGGDALAESRHSRLYDQWLLKQAGTDKRSLRSKGAYSAEIRALEDAWEGQPYQVFNRHSAETQQFDTLEEALTAVSARRDPHDIVEHAGSGRLVGRWEHRQSATKGRFIPDGVGAGNGKNKSPNEIGPIRAMFNKPGMELDVKKMRETLAERRGTKLYSGLPTDLIGQAMRDLYSQVTVGRAAGARRVLSEAGEELLDIVEEAVRLEARAIFGDHRLKQFTNDLFVTPREHERLTRWMRPVASAFKRAEKRNGIVLVTDADADRLLDLAQQTGVTLTRGQLKKGLTPDQASDLSHAIAKSMAGQSAYVDFAMGMTPSGTTMLGKGLRLLDPRQIRPKGMKPGQVPTQTALESARQSVARAAARVVDIPHHRLNPAAKLELERGQNILNNVSKNMQRDLTDTVREMKKQGLQPTTDELLRTVMGRDYAPPNGRQLRVGRAVQQMGPLSPSGIQYLAKAARSAGVNPRYKKIADLLDDSNPAAQLEGIHSWAAKVRREAQRHGEMVIRSALDGDAEDIIEAVRREQPDLLEKLHELVWVKGATDEDLQKLLAPIAGNVSVHPVDRTMLGVLLNLRADGEMSGILRRMVAKHMAVPANSPQARLVDAILRGQDSYTVKVKDKFGQPVIRKVIDAPEVDYLHAMRNIRKMGLDGTVGEKTARKGSAQLAPAMKKALEEARASGVKLDERQFFQWGRWARQNMTSGFVVPNMAYTVSNFLDGLSMIMRWQGVTGLMRTFADAIEEAPLVKRLIAYESELTPLYRGRNASERMMVTSAGEVVTDRQLLDWMREYSVGTTYAHELSATQLLDEVRRMDPDFHRRMSSRVGRAFTGEGMVRLNRMAEEFAHTMESFHRTSVFVSGIKRGLGPAAAAKEARDALYDFGRLTPFERAWSRRLFIFYTFMKRNAVSNIKAFAKDPGRVMRQARFFSMQPELWGMTEAEQMGRKPSDEARLILAGTRPLRMSNGTLLPDYSGVYNMTTPMSGPDALFLLHDLYNAMKYRPGQTSVDGQKLPEESIRTLASNASPLIGELYKVLAEEDLRTRFPQTRFKGNEVPPIFGENPLFYQIAAPMLGLDQVKAETPFEYGVANPEAPSDWYKWVATGTRGQTILSAYELSGVGRTVNEKVVAGSRIASSMSPVYFSSHPLPWNSEAQSWMQLFGLPPRVVLSGPRALERQQESAARQIDDMTEYERSRR